MSEDENGSPQFQQADSHPTQGHRTTEESTMQGDDDAHARVQEPLNPDPRLLTPHLIAQHDLIPLHRWDYVDGKGRERGKSPRDEDWRRRDYSKFDAVAHMRNGGNVGVRLRDIDLIIDVDPRNFYPPNGPLYGVNGNTISPFDELMLQLGLVPDAWNWVDTGGGGQHYYLRKPAGLQVVRALPDFPGVEFKTVGVQVVAGGSLHPKSKKHYTVDPFSALNVRLDAPAALLDSITKPKTTQAYGSGPIGAELLRKLLAGLDPENYRDHERWLAMMMAAHHATAGEGRDEFIDWSTSDPAFADHSTVIAQRWDSLDPAKQGGRTLGSIIKELKDAGREDLVAAAKSASVTDAMGDVTSVDEAIEVLNRKHAVVSENGKFTVFNEELDPESGFLRWTRSTKADFKDLYENRRMADGKSVAALWLQSLNRRQYRGVAFNPAGTSPDVLNLWRGWAVQPVDGDWSLMREMIRNVICSGDTTSFDYAMNWLAFLFQHPERQAEVAFVMRGKKGVGKGTLAEALLTIAGAHGMAVSDTEKIAGRFNSHLRDTVFLFADEAFWAGNKNQEATLKKVITDRDIVYEQKHKDAGMGVNRIHLMMASNDAWTVPASLGDERRFFVVDVSEAKRGEKAYFGAIRRQLANGGLQAMLFDLLKRDIHGWHPRDDVPHTAALTEQMLHGMNPMEQWWFSIVERGELPYGVAPLGSGWLNQVVLGPCEKNALVEDHAKWLRERHMSRRPVQQKGMLNFLREFGCVTERQSSDTRVWIIPSLEDVKSAFRTKVKHDPFD